jgi:predicted 2-oxoglutarate/Fe(II)-dependent dioxygenase YbiX
MLGVGKRFNHAALRKLGVFIRPQVLNRAECERLCAEAAAGRLDRATVGTPSSADPATQVYEKVRRTKYVRVPPATIAALEQRLLALRPDLDAFFEVRLARCAGTQLLAYQPGDFFRAHQDAPDSADQPCPPEIRRRKVSAILFLNQQAKKAKADEYSGGFLNFNGLLDDKGAQGAGIAVVPEPGLLVAFCSTVWHHVDEVSAGTRYTLVTWFEEVAAAEQVSAAGA